MCSYLFSTMESTDAMMEVDNIASDVKVQGTNNTISNGNRTVKYTVNIENYHAAPSDSQQPSPLQIPFLQASPVPLMPDEEEDDNTFAECETNTALQLRLLRLLRLVDYYSFVTHKDVNWLTGKTVGGCQSSKRNELYEHLDMDAQEVESICREQQIQGQQSLEEEVYSILNHGLRVKEKRTRRYLLEKLQTFDPYLARSYMSFLTRVLLETLLEKRLTLQDVIWMTDKLVGGFCFNRVNSLYVLFDIEDEDIERIRTNYVRKGDSIVDEVFMILDYGLRIQKKKRRYLFENLLLFDEDLAHSYQEYLLSQ